MLEYIFPFPYLETLFIRLFIYLFIYSLFFRNLNCVSKPRNRHFKLEMIASKNFLRCFKTREWVRQLTTFYANKDFKSTRFIILSIFKIFFCFSRDIYIFFVMIVRNEESSQLNEVKHGSFFKRKYILNFFKFFRLRASEFFNK